MENINQIVQVKVEDIIPNRYQPRIKFDEQDLLELSDSIKQHGIIQPLTLRPFGQKFEIIAGERRYRAALMCGLKTVPSIIMNVNDETSAELALIENLQRKNLNAIEEAKSYKKILDISNITQEELSKHLGKNQSTIANKLRLLNLDSEIQEAVLNNKISERHARSLLQISNKDLQKEILKKIITEKLTVKLTEDLIASNYKKIDDNLNKKLEIKKYSNTDSSTNLVDISKEINKTGDEIKMNEQNYNNIMNQQAPTIPDTPIPTQSPAPQQNNSIFNNNFFPSLEDEKTNMQLSPLNDQTQSTANQNIVNPIPQVPEMPNNLTPSQPENPWEVPTELSSQTNNNNSELNVPNNSLEMNQNLNIEQNQQINPWSPITDSNLSPIEETTTPQPTNINMAPQGFNIPDQESIQNTNAPETDSLSSNISIPNYESINNINQNMSQPSQFMNQISQPTTNVNSVGATVTTQSPFEQPEQTVQQISNLNPSLNQTQSVPGFIDQSITNIPSQFAPQPNIDINNTVNKIRQTISEIESSGAKIQSSELDLDTEYQIIIKIPKESN